MNGTPWKCKFFDDQKECTYSAPDVVHMLIIDVIVSPNQDKIR